MDPSDIGAAEFLAIKRNAAFTSEGKTALRALTEHLRQHPAAEERLVLDLIAAALAAMQEGASPGPIIASTVPFLRSVTDQKLLDCLAKLEQVAITSFRLLGAAPREPEHQLSLEVAFTTSIIAIAKRDYDRARNAIETLRTFSHAARKDARSEMLHKAERLVEKARHASHW
jgi:hypothetical protein